MKQICNLAYALLIENRTKVQIAELEVMLTEPERKDEMIQRQNQESMNVFAGAAPMGLLVPMPTRRRPPGPPAGGPKDDS